LTLVLIVMSSTGRGAQAASRKTRIATRESA
jgi:hypothetical protein